MQQQLRVYGSRMNTVDEVMSGKVCSRTLLVQPSTSGEATENVHTCK